MSLYCGIDLHAVNNSYLVVTGPQDEVTWVSGCRMSMDGIRRVRSRTEVSLQAYRGRVDLQLVLAGGWSA